MTISSANIDDTRPVEGNPTTQSVRDNFTEIKTQFDNTQADLTAQDYANIAALRAITSTPSVTYTKTKGSTTDGDGGEGDWYWDSTSTAADNGGTIIKATAITTGRWTRLYSGDIYAAWFNPITSTNVQAALDSLGDAGVSGIVRLPDGIYSFDAKVNIPKGCKLKGNYSSYVAGMGAIITADNTGGDACIEVGDGTTLANDAGVENIQVNAGTNTSGIGIHFNYARQSNIKHVRVDGFTTGSGIKFNGQVSGGGASIDNSIEDAYLAGSLTNLLLTGEDADNTSASDEGTFIDVWVQLGGLANAKGIHLEKAGNNEFMSTSIVDSAGYTSGTIGLHFDDGARTIGYAARSNVFNGLIVEKATESVQFEANTANNRISDLRYVNTISPVNDLSGGNNVVEHIRAPYNQVQKTTYHNSQNYQNFLPNSEFERWESGTAAAPSDWTLTTSTCARDAVNQRKGTYCAALTWGGSAGSLKYIMQNWGHFKGQVVTFGKWIKTSGADTARIDLFDGVNHVRSGYHSGGGDYEFISVRAKIDAAASGISFIINQDADNVMYIDQAVAVDGMELPIPQDTPLLDRNTLYKSFTYDVGSLADGAGETHSESVIGAALGDFVQVSSNIDLQDMTVTAYVQAANTVEIRVQNESGGVVDLASAAWHILITKRQTA